MCTASGTISPSAHILHAVIKYFSEWDDTALVKNPIYEGFRRDIVGSEYFDSDTRRDVTLPIVVKGCHVARRVSCNPKMSQYTFSTGEIL